MSNIFNSSDGHNTLDHYLVIVTFDENDQIIGSVEDASYIYISFRFLSLIYNMLIAI